MELKNVEILRIGDLQTFDSGFKKVEFIVKTSEQYPQTLKLESKKDKADEVIKFNKVGDKVDVSINLLGREWENDKGEVFVFNTREAWKVFKSKDEEQTEMKIEEPVSDVETVSDAETEDDLPF